MAIIKGDGRGNELRGTSREDIIRGLDGNDELEGRAGDDRLEGGRGHDELDGDEGNDTLYGGSGNDELDGGNGADVLRGGAGRDEIDGGRGNDLLFGGSGGDIFSFDLRDGDDVIGDFASGVDRIEFDIDGLRFRDLTIENNAQGDAVITWNDAAGSSITLDGVDAASLSRSDFIFDA